MSLASMSLLELAASVRGDRITYEAVAAEWNRRKAMGLNPDTGGPTQPSSASAPTVSATACPNCGSLQRAPVEAL